MRRVIKTKPEYEAALAEIRKILSRDPDPGTREGDELELLTVLVQNYENGRAKNDSTNRRFRAVVRILKTLRNEMAEARIAAADPIPSYLSECLVWNVPNEGFDRGSYVADVRWALAHLFNSTLTEDAVKEWGEVNELKYLFRTGQPWNREAAHAFLAHAWDYIGFK